MKPLPLFCLLLVALVSCQNPGSHTTGVSSPKQIIPPVPTARELARDTNWIPCDVKADWVYLENAPAGYKYADWVPLLNGSYEWNKEWVNRQPRRKFADGPGTLWLRKKDLSFGTMFQMDNDLLEVTGDWRNGRLMRAVKIRGAGELAQRQLNWDAINAGFGAGVVAMAPFVWTGAKMVEALTTPTSQSGGAGATASGDEDPTELSRFAKRHNGGLWNFTVVRDYMDGTIVLENAEGKQWQVSYSASVLPSADHYNKGKTGGLTLNNESLVGAKMEVYFHGDGTPESIKNLGNGNTSRVRTWKVTGFGW